MEDEFINNFKKIYLDHMNTHLFLVEDDKDIQQIEKLKGVLESTVFTPTNSSLFTTIINKYNKIIQKWQ